MKAHLAKVSLALLSTVFLLGCQDMGSEPVGPGPEFDKPGNVCEAHCHDDDAVDPDPITLTLANGMQATDLPVDVTKDTRKTLKVSNSNLEKPPIKMAFTGDDNTCVGVVGTNGGTVPEPKDPVFTALLAQLTATEVTGKFIMNIDKTGLVVNEGPNTSGRHAVFVQYESSHPLLGTIRISIGSVFDDVAATVTWTQTGGGPDVFLFTGPVVVWDAGGGIKDQSVIQCPDQTVLVTLKR